MRTNVTIPPAGEKKVVNLSGLSVEVEQMPVYSEAAQVPEINFVPGERYPMYPRSVYPNSEPFTQIELIGTQEAAGDEVYLISTEQCLQFELNQQFQSTKKYIAGQTKSKASTDASQGLAEVELQKNGNLPVELFIEARNEPLVYAFDTPAGRNGESNLLVPGDKTLSSPEPSETKKIVGIDRILKLQFASAVSGTPGNLIYSGTY